MPAKSPKGLEMKGLDGSNPPLSSSEALRTVRLLRGSNFWRAVQARPATNFGSTFGWSTLPRVSKSEGSRGFKSSPLHQPVRCFRIPSLSLKDADM